MDHLQGIAHMGIVADSKEKIFIMSKIIKRNSLDKKIKLTLTLLGRIEGQTIRDNVRQSNLLIPIILFTNDEQGVTCNINKM